VTVSVAFPLGTIPTLPTLSLSEHERTLIAEMSMLRMRREFDMRESEAFLLGKYRVDNLRIAVPKEVEDRVRTIVGWPSLSVDPYVERLTVDGFRLPNATDVDVELADVMVENGFDALMPLATTDALALSHVWWTVGSPDEPGYAPRVTVESPLNMVAKWNLRGDRPEAAWQQYWQDGRAHAVLYLPRQTIHLSANDAGEWEIANRDEHDFDFVPVVRMAHAPMTSQRDGRSAITPALRSHTISASRDLMGIELAREIWATPRLFILGATEEAFRKADGSKKSKFETYMSILNAFERDEQGAVPDIKQIMAYDPSSLLKPFEERASQVASIVAAPPQDVGLYTQGNPTSAEARQAAEFTRNRRARQMQRTFGPELARVAQMVMRFQNSGSLPREYRRLTTDWVEVDEQPMSIASDAISKQISVGAVPPTSDVTLKRLGYSSVERRQLEEDRRGDALGDLRMIRESAQQQAAADADAV